MGTESIVQTLLGKVRCLERVLGRLPSRNPRCFRPTISNDFPPGGGPCADRERTAHGRRMISVFKGRGMDLPMCGSMCRG